MTETKYLLTLNIKNLLSASSTVLNICWLNIFNLERSVNGIDNILLNESSDRLGSSYENCVKTISEI